MSTTTTDPVAELEQLEAKAQTARDEAAAIGVRVRAHQARYQQLQSQLAELAGTAPVEFDDDGNPRGEQAKKLQRELSKVTTSRLPDMAAGAQERARVAEAEVNRIKAANVVELVRAKQPQAEVARDKLIAALDAVLEATNAYYGVRGEVIGLIGTTGITGQDLPPDELIGEIRRFASDAREREIELPLPYSIVPGKRSPRFALKADGEWISAHVSGNDELADPQPVEFDWNASEARLGR